MGNLLEKRHLVAAAPNWAVAHKTKAGVDEQMSLSIHAGLLFNGPPGINRVVLRLVVRLFI
jgi:hypothetical protein